MIIEESLENNKIKKKKKILEINLELSLTITLEIKNRYKIFLKLL
jgi:hypothetical protein